MAKNAETVSQEVARKDMAGLSGYALRVKRYQQVYGLHSWLQRKLAAKKDIKHQAILDQLREDGIADYVKKQSAGQEARFSVTWTTPNDRSLGAVLRAVKKWKEERHEQEMDLESSDEMPADKSGKGKATQPRLSDDFDELANNVPTAVANKRKKPAQGDKTGGSSSKAQASAPKPGRISNGTLPRPGTSTRAGTSDRAGAFSHDRTSTCAGPSADAGPSNHAGPSARTGAPGRSGAPTRAGSKTDDGAPARAGSKVDVDPSTDAGNMAQEQQRLTAALEAFPRDRTEELDLLKHIREYASRHTNVIPLLNSAVNDLTKGMGHVSLQGPGQEGQLIHHHFHHGEGGASRDASPAGPDVNEVPPRAWFQWWLDGHLRRIGR